MKRILLFVGIIILVALSLFLFCVLDADRWFNEMAFEDLPIVTLEQSVSVTGADPDIPSGYTTDSDNGGSPLIKLSYGGASLPEVNGEILIPVLPESGLTVTFERSAAVTKAKVANGWQITAEKNGISRSVTLTETGIGVCMLTLTNNDIRDAEEPIDDAKDAASLTLLWPDESGKPVLETASVTLSIRGQISRSFKKKSYTIELGSENGSARSLMGLPADTRFGLNSMYEDGSKIRDALSLSLWREMASPEDRADATGYRYLELFIDGEYRGLYGLQQLLTAETADLTAGDGLVKIAHPLSGSYSANMTKLKANLEVIEPAAGADILNLFATGLTHLAAGEEEALSLFDTESLMRVFLFIQATGAVDNLYQNLAGVWRADRKLFTMIPFDTDLTFGLTNGGPKIAPKDWPKKKVSDMDMATTDESMFRPIMGILRYDGRFKKPLSELYFSLRETALSEETLLSAARELFDRVTASGAREREHLRWPEGAYTETNGEIETFIAERIAWCDAYFQSLTEKEEK